MKEEEEKIAAEKAKAEVEAKRMEEQRVVAEKAAVEAKRIEEERLAAEKAAAEAVDVTFERFRFESLAEMLTVVESNRPLLLSGQSIAW